jgi:hypothetical protein
MKSFSVQLESPLAEPFVRARLRVQAELMLDDADRIGQETWEDRTDEQRAADAFVALALGVADASRAS